ncbi:MAG: hypothetical protein JW809_17065 [Pirellulales bacterium]|nr:hypothetical protein [Pirellulales bacterium]
MSELLQEYVDSRGMAMRVDRAAGVIRGVKILGRQSRNGRLYPAQTLLDAAPLYEGAKVNVNHPKPSAGAPRDYQDRIGSIRNVVARPDEGLFADFHFNPKHTLAEQLLWDAEHAPEHVGFSHNVEARTARRGDQVVVEAITRVASVDLVADPATTQGLYESVDEASEAPDGQTLGESRGDAAREPALDWPALSVAALRQRRPDLVESLRAEADGELAALREELDALRAAQVAAARRAAAQTLLAQAGLPDLDADDPSARAVLDARFVESLLAAPDESVLRALIDQRARLVRAAAQRFTPRPQSREQTPPAGASPPDVETFVKAIT